MIQIDFVGLYFLGAELQAAKNLRFMSGADEKLDAFISVEYWIGQFLSPQSVLQLPKSKRIAQRLLELVREATRKLDSDTGFIDERMIEAIETTLKSFEDTLAVELKDLLIFYVAQEGMYSVRTLLYNAEEALSENARTLLSAEALRDFRQGGVSLVFALPTAAGFHFVRATERMLREYFKVAIGRDAGEERLDWGRCIRELEKHEADLKVVSVLDQIRDLHRNPLMHPDVELTISEASRLFSICGSAIESMADQVIRLKAGASE